MLQSHLRRGNSAWKHNWEEGERREDMRDKNYFFFFPPFFTLLPINSSFSVQGFREQAVYLQLLKKSHYEHSITNANPNAQLAVQAFPVLFTSHHKSHKKIKWCAGFSGRNFKGSTDFRIATEASFTPHNQRAERITREPNAQKCSPSCMHLGSLPRVGLLSESEQPAFI